MVFHLKLKHLADKFDLRQITIWRFHLSLECSEMLNRHSGVSPMEIDDGFQSSDADLDKVGEDVEILLPLTQLERAKNGEQILDFIEAHSFRSWVNRIRYGSPFRIFQRTVDHREEVSLSVFSPISLQQRLPLNFLQNVEWHSLLGTSKEWIRQPKNFALLIWSTCVFVSALMLGLQLLGVLDRVFPSTSSRNRWIEINNQVLNALFTLMSLYQHPDLVYHFFLLCRWKSEHIKALRKIYSKNGTYRPHEWVHMMVVVVLLHITCLAQYISCCLYWGYMRVQRVELAEMFFFVLGIAAPILAGVYTVYSPLGRETDAELDEELHDPTSSYVKEPCDAALKINKLRWLVKNPKWSGGLFDCNDNITVGCLSLFCTFCVFGWNMERLGFGNMYVHMITFFLLCIAPFWIFNISALNIHDKVIGDIVGIAGIILCAFGLLYGGFWRIQMRKRFRLPENTFCCDSASLTDYVQWMFCWPCSLAQEVRTGNLYEVEDDNLYNKKSANDEDVHPLLHPLPRENSRNVISKSESSFLTTDKKLHDSNEKSSLMKPPVQPCFGKETSVQELID